MIVGTMSILNSELYHEKDRCFLLAKQSIRRDYIVIEETFCTTEEMCYDVHIDEQKRAKDFSHPHYHLAVTVQATGDKPIVNGVVEHG